MPRAAAIVLHAVLSSVAVWMAAPASAQSVPEPEGYRMEDYRSPTPMTLRGARVVSAEDAFDLWREGAALFVDVMPNTPKPAGLAPGTIWRDKPHHTIPRAAWLPNVGYGRLAAETDAYFRRSLEALTGGDKAKALVFFCAADCWMSWNAAKRAREDYGYTQVMWFREGTEGWVFPGFDTGLVQAAPRP